MNVIGLKKILEMYPDEMEIIIPQYSDYINDVELEVILGVDKGTWIMTGHHSMSDENKGKAKDYLLIN